MTNRYAPQPLAGDASFTTRTAVAPPAIVNDIVEIGNGLPPVSASQFEDKWRLTGLAGILVAQAAARRMVAQGHGSILITGATASVRGKPLFAAFASAKAALRSFTASLAWEVAPRGVHVAHIVIDGMVAGHRARSALGGLGNLVVWQRGQEGCLRPPEVAETYWQLHQQAAGAWTHEADLRPFKEPF